MSILSTHRGRDSVFNQIITEITQKGNPMKWSHHRVTIHDAVARGLVEKINEKSGRNDSRESFVTNLRAKCIDEEQWQQEYCCAPADESSAFITYDMLAACEAKGCMTGENHPGDGFPSKLPSDSDGVTLRKELPSEAKGRQSCAIFPSLRQGIPWISNR